MTRFTVSIANAQVTVLNIEVEHGPAMAGDAVTIRDPSGLKAAE